MILNTTFPAILLATTTCGFGALSIEINLGSHTSTAGTVSDSSLWAVVIDQNGDNNLPAGLGDGSSLTIGQASAAFNSFSGKTISEGTLIGPDSILRVFEVDGVDTSGTGGLSVQTITLNDTAWQAVAGKQWAIYWFPGLTTGSATLPTAVFDIGGIRQNQIGNSGGNVGMTIPAFIDNTTTSLTAAFVDNISNGGDLPIERLKAVAVPEPATLTFSALGLAALLRRRRG